MEDVLKIATMLLKTPYNRGQDLDGDLSINGYFHSLNNDYQFPIHPLLLEADSVVTVGNKPFISRYEMGRYGHFEHLLDSWNTHAHAGKVYTGFVKFFQIPSNNHVGLSINMIDGVIYVQDVQGRLLFTFNLLISEKSSGIPVTLYNKSKYYSLKISDDKTVEIVIHDEPVGNSPELPDLLFVNNSTAR